MRKVTSLVCAAVMTSAVTPAARAFDPDEDRATRVLVESGTGLVGGAFGGLAGGLLGLGLCSLSGEASRGWGCLGPALIGTGVGAWWGMAGGVVLGGEAMEANGGFGWELLGQLGGTAVAGGLFAALSDVIDSEELWVTLWIVLPLAGGVIGYELSTEATVERRASAWVVPLTLRF